MARRAIKRSRYSATRNEGEHVQARQHLVDLPFDVLLEIFLFLEPAELLYLSRTTKSFRAFILNRRNASALWKNAINNVGLPPCPHWTSPPAYAFLAFDPLCHKCYRNCETIEWDLRMRCCPTCFPKTTTQKYCSNIDNLDLPIARRRNELKDEGWNIHLHVVDDHPVRTFSRSDWKFVRTSEWSMNLSLENFVTQQNEFWKSVRFHARQCRVWERGWLEKKATHLLQARIERVEDIKCKLTEMGCLETVVSFCDHPDFCRLPEVKRFEPLKPEEWMKLHPRLVRWLEEALCDDRRHALESTILQLDTGPLLVQPRHVDIATIPAVRSIMEPHMISELSKWDLTKKLQRMLRQTIEEWSANVVEELEQVARKELNLRPRSKPSVILPVIFRCKTCRQRLRFNEALSHVHLYKAKPARHSTRTIPPYDRLLESYSTYPRNTQVLRVDVIASQRVENLIRQLRQSPDKVTYDELTQSTAKVVCSLCRPKVATGMNFKDAFKHCLDSHPGKNETEVWTCESATD